MWVDLFPVSRWSRKITSTEAVPEESAVETAARTEVTERSVA